MAVIIKYMYTSLEKISSSFGSWHAAIDLANKFLSIVIDKKNKKQFTLIERYTSNFLSSPILCHNTIYRRVG